MANPKHLILQLHRHWEVVEQLCHLTKTMTNFEPAQAISVVERFGAQAQEAPDVLRALCNADVLQTLSRSDNLQLNPLVLEFIRGLTHEHELGLSTVLKARIDAIQEACRLIAQGIDEQDMDRLRQGAARLSDLLRQIEQQLNQDQHAIKELAEKAKATNASMSPARRYRTVLEAYEQYVEPINSMIDSSLDGVFYQHLEQAVSVLDRAEEHLAVLGAHYSHRIQLKHAAQQAKELKRIGRISAQQCAETLLPLREEIRQHSSLSSAVTEVLAIVRKRGLRRALPKNNLPLWRRETRRYIQLGDEIRELMAQARGFESKSQAFPEALSDAERPELVWIDEQQLRNDLSHALPIDNLLQWLKTQYPQAPDAVLMRIYHEIVRESQWQAQLSKQQTSTALKSVRVTYYPHQLPLDAKDNQKHV